MKKKTLLMFEIYRMVVNFRGRRHDLERIFRDFEFLTNSQLAGQQ